MADKERSAGGLVERDGKILLVQVCNLKQEVVWCLPKGHLEKGETPEQAAVREVTEETGWQCESLGPIMQVGYFFRRQGRLVSKKVDWFAMRPKKKVGTPDALEVLKTRWTAVEEAKELLQYPSDRQVLDKWMSA